MPGEVVDRSDQLRTDVAEIDGGPLRGSAVTLAELLQELQLRGLRLQVPPDVGLEQSPGEGTEDRLHLLLALHDADWCRGRARAVVRGFVAVQGAGSSSRRRLPPATFGVSVLPVTGGAALESDAQGPCLVGEVEAASAALPLQPPEDELPLQPVDLLVRLLRELPVVDELLEQGLLVVLREHRDIARWRDPDGGSRLAAICHGLH